MAGSAPRLIVLAALGCGGRAATPPAPMTTIDPAAVPTLDRWAAAIGGRDRLVALAGTHEVGVVTHDGFPPGTYELWWTSRGERLYRESTGGFETMAVFDGTRGWSRDGSGNVRDLHGDELAFERTFSFWMTSAALIPNRWPGEVRAAPSDRIVFTPTDGHTTTVTFDATTHRPSSYVEVDGDLVIADVLDDWREVDGVWLSFRSHRTWNGHASTSWQATTADHAPPPPFVQPMPRPVPPLATAVTVPIDVSSGIARVAVRVDDAGPFQFVIDTGAAYSSIRRELAGDHPTIPHATIHIGEVEFADTSLDTHKVDAETRRAFGPLDGILGYDVLAKYVVEIDAITKTMRFIDRDAYRHPPGGNEIAIAIEHGIPTFAITLELPNRPPIEAHVALDTSCQCIVKMGSAFTAKNRLVDGLDTQPIDVGNGVTGAIARIDGVQIGAIRFARPFAAFGIKPETRDPTIVGLVGFAALRDYRLVLDLPHRRIWLDPSTSAAGSD